MRVDGTTVKVGTKLSQFLHGDDDDTEFLARFGHCAFEEADQATRERLTPPCSWLYANMADRLEYPLLVCRLKESKKNKKARKN